MPLDILALAAHRDDVEQTCAGTLLKMAERGYRTGILDLTQGEMGTRGTAEDRARHSRWPRRKYLGESPEGRPRASRTAAAGVDSSLLGGPPSGSLHRLDSR